MLHRRFFSTVEFVVVDPGLPVLAEPVMGIWRREGDTPRALRVEYREVTTEGCV